jgi:hypothetical protein
MTKQQLLKKVHHIIWKTDDDMLQETLFELQDLIDNEIFAEADAGTMDVKQLENGYISHIRIVSE